MINCSLRPPNVLTPAIIQEFNRSFKLVRSLPCDVQVGDHPAQYSMQEKYAKIGKGLNPFIGGQQGCLADIDGWEQGFKKRLAEDQKKVSAALTQ